MNYFLDTDTCIFVLRGRFPAIKTHLQALSPERIKIPAIVKAELLLAVQKSGEAHHKIIVEKFLSPFEVVAFCDRCTLVYAEIRNFLEAKGQPIGPNDLLIAATVQANQGTLVTHNTKEYKRVPDLKIQDWVEI